MHYLIYWGYILIVIGIIFSYIGFELEFDKRLGITIPKGYHLEAFNENYILSDNKTTYTRHPVYLVKDGAIQKTINTKLSFEIIDSKEREQCQ